MSRGVYEEIVFTGTGNGVQVQDGTASSNRFATTTASPTSLGSIMRSNILVRPSDQPITFPMDVQDFREMEG